MENIFKGLGVALVTPFHADGTIDYNSLGNIVEYQLTNGVDFLCVLGTTAETPCLSASEKISIKKYVTEIVKGRVPILLGMGGNCTKALADEIANYDFTGVDGILSVVPFYNKPAQEGIYQHYMTISKAAKGMPIVLYNVPGRTGVNMSAQTTLRLASDADNIIAIKEASGNVEQIKEIIDNAPAGFEVLSGDDSLACQLIGMGAKGVISVVGNGIPNDFSAMIHASMEGCTERATSINTSLKELYSLAFIDGNPAGIKALLANKGLCENILRLPLVPASAQTIGALKKFA